jgi:hypothetical protein
LRFDYAQHSDQLADPRGGRFTYIQSIMNPALELFFTAGQAASALLLVYGGFLAVAPNLFLSSPSGELAGRAPASSA